MNENWAHVHCRWISITSTKWWYHHFHFFSLSLVAPMAKPVILANMLFVWSTWNGIQCKFNKIRKEIEQKCRETWNIVKFLSHCSGSDSDSSGGSGISNSKPKSTTNILASSILGLDFTYQGIQWISLNILLIRVLFFVVQRHRISSGRLMKSLFIWICSRRVFVCRSYPLWNENNIQVNDMDVWMMRFVCVWHVQW